MCQKNVSVLLVVMIAEEYYAFGFFGEKSKPLFCRLENGVIFTTSLTIVMFHGDPMMSRVTEIVDRVVQEYLYNY
jgi:hypothetical protein